MNPIVRNILAFIAGVVAGNVVNGGIIMIGGQIIVLPAGVDNTSMDGLKASLHLFEPKHFVTPFLAHALGTFAGALIAALIAVNNKMRFAIAIGIFFLIAGVYMVFMLPSPIGFTIIDLFGAYIPMAWLGGKLALLNQK